MDFKKIFILILSTLFFSPLYSTAMDNAKKDEPDPEDKCIICFDEFRNTPDFVKLPCNHFFHSYCINIWRKKQTWCPVCREKAPCLFCNQKIEDTDDCKGRPVITPCGHNLHFSCLMQYKDGGIYWHNLGYIGGGIYKYCCLTRKDQCIVCNECLPSWFLKEIEKKYDPDHMSFNSSYYPTDDSEESEEDE